MDHVVWSEVPPSQEEVAEERARADTSWRAVRRLLRTGAVLGLGVGVVAGVVGLWSWAANWPPLGSGDPHGSELRMLQSVRLALPPGSRNVRIGGNEPTFMWSCAVGTPETLRGWTSVNGWVIFTSRLPALAVMGEVTAAMAGDGWVHPRDARSVPWATVWEKRLPNGGRAMVGLGHDYGHVDEWRLSGTATPDRPVGACQAP